jgi:hypothetical protein
LVENAGYKENIEVEGLQNFFHIALSHDSLNNYFQTNFAMMQHHKYSLTELENMLPWEREIYLTMLIRYLEGRRTKN